MTRFLPSTLAVFALSVSQLSTAAQSPTPPKPTATVWMSPPGHDSGKAFRDLFEHPDDWKETRSLVDVLFTTDLTLKHDFKDDELTRWFAQMRDWKLKFAMEVGALKPWGKTGAECFAKERNNWENLQKLGADFYAIAMDEPLVCTRNDLRESDDYAVEQTADYIALVRQNYPQMLIGDIEAYPFTPVEEHEHWIEALNQRLAEKNVRGLDFYRIDVDWLHFVVGSKGSWKDLRQLDRWCHQKKLPFQLIYWAAGYPSLQRRGLADDSTWYVSTLEQGYNYAENDGHPDAFVIESWIDAPSKCLPETADWTFTRSVRDFARKFAKP